MAVTYNGSNEYAQASSVIGSAWTTFSAGTWVILAAGNTGSAHYLIGEGSDVAGDGFQVFYRGSTSPAQIRLQASAGGGPWANINIYWQVTWGVGEEHHILITRNGTTYLLYEDGVLNTNKTEAATNAGAIDATITPARLAVRPNDAKYGYFAGTLWDGRIANVDYSAEEAKIIYESRGNDNITRGLEARWLGNEGTDASNATTITDISGGSRPMTAFNTPVYSAQGIKVVK